MMDFHGNDIADCVLRQFDKLPKKRKPQDRGNGIREWVPISGIVTKGRSSGEGNWSEELMNLRRKQWDEMCRFGVSDIPIDFRRIQS